jgi:S-adenosylmethionine decarboxylase
MQVPVGLRVDPAQRRTQSHPGRAPEPDAAPEQEERPASMGFGPHLVFDGSGCPADRLGNLSLLYTLLDRLPDQIHMTKVMPPYVFRHGTPGDPTEGLSGFVLIAESHISIHTFPVRRYVNIDIFSCENFDVEDALNKLRQAFLPRQVDWKLFDRGREFPKHLASSRSIVARDRRALARSLGLEASR